jgi:AcrR family transcriptional regulator
MPSEPSTMSRVSLPYSGRTESFHTVMTERILRAGLDLARETGEAGLTMRAIASRCGVSPTELYRHFPSKEAILSAIRRHGVHQLGLWLCGDADSGRSMGLEQLCQQYYEFACQRPWLYRIMFRAAAVGREDPAVETFLGRARRLLADDPDGLTRAQHLWMAMHGLALAATDLDPGDVEPGGDRSVRLDPPFIGAYIRAVLRGLGTLPTRLSNIEQLRTEIL